MLALVSVDKFFRALNTNSGNNGAGEGTEETVNGITTTVAMPLTGGPGLKPASIMDLFGGGGTESESITPQKPIEFVGAERPTQERNGGSLFGIEKLLGLAGGMTVDKAQTITKPSVESPITASIEQPTDPGDNLLGSILNGHFGEIDWIGSLLGTKQTPSQEEGNAMAQLFKGGFFGPADDSV
ncbi:unnamed protein product [Anisakis simplex]|uniref:DUF937 domain-containing protein n=1 Tax=Anisakis simplex TaxID=6269 RepID=A0A0M3J299_ANISI|nr:unnamed protein product [Anisakis simplex]